MNELGKLVSGARRSDESFEDYKRRQKIANKIVSNSLKRGNLSWDSSKNGSFKSK